MSSLKRPSSSPRSPAWKRRESGTVGSRCLSTGSRPRAESRGFRRGLRKGLAIVALLAGATFSHAELQAGDPLPPLGSAPGTPPTRDHVVLLDFWASWCAPCKASFPAFARLHNDFAGRGLVIIAVGVDDKVSAHETFLRRMQPPFFTMRDADHSIVSAAGVPAMPTSYLFGRDGKLRYMHRGFHGTDTEKELRTEIEALLKEEK